MLFCYRDNPKNKKFVLIVISMNLKKDTVFNLLIVFIPIVILTLIVSISMIKKKGKVKRIEAQFDISNIEKALNEYFKDKGYYPTTDDGLYLLISAKNKEGKPYLNKIKKDPWGKQYYYHSPGINNKDKYDLWSYGADKTEGGDGINRDITNWN